MTPQSSALPTGAAPNTEHPQTKLPSRSQHPKKSAPGRVLAFLATWRSLPPYELASYPLMFASVPMLAAGIRHYNAALVATILFTVVALYGGFFAALIWNDITDADIDSVAHPDRPIPSGRISTSRFFKIAVFFSIITTGFAYLISAWCLAVNVFAALFVALHNKVLKRTVKIPAYSEIFTPFQWVVVGIFGYVAIWSRHPSNDSPVITLPGLGSLATSATEFGKMILLVLFIYFTDSCHDIPEGIADEGGDRLAGVRTYATSFGAKNAARVALAWFVLSGLLGVMLFATTSLSYLFLIPYFILFFYTGGYFLRLSRMSDIAAINAFAPTVGRKGFNHFLFTFDLIFIDLLTRIRFD